MERPRRVTPWGVRERLRALPGGDLLVRAGVFLLGAAFVVLGLVLIVLPGPLTLPPILLGLFIWSLEFAFAERLLGRARSSAATAWQQARARPWTTGLATAMGLLLALAAALVLSRYGVSGLYDRARDLIDSVLHSMG